MKLRHQLTEKQLQEALEHCASEPIHIPGSIQPHGFLLALDNASHKIIQVSENIEQFIGVTPAACLGKLATDILGPECMHAIDAVKISSALEPIQSMRVRVQEVEFDLVAHTSGANVIVELEPFKPKTVEGVDAFYDVTRNFAVGINKAQNLPQLYSHVVESIRKVTGIDRVKLYKFDAEWNGSVIAESKADFMPSYLGMRFPASDIPEQARILYTKNYLRLIPDIYYAAVPLVSSGITEPLDLSLSMLRSVSPVHIQYLDNMRVRASLSVSIIQNGKLWGLVACHHNSELHVGYQARMVTEIMGHIFSAQLSTLENQSKKEEHDAQMLFIERLNAALENNFQFPYLLESTQNLALTAMKAGGMVAHVKGTYYRYGKTPSNAEIITLYEWLSKNQNQIVFHTVDATSEPGLNDISGGFLSASLSQNPEDFIVWFREPLVEEAKWAGNPEKSVEETYAGYRLTPRASFEIWKEIVSQNCAAWTYDNIDTARNFVNVVLECEKVVAEQANLAKSEFLANMSHEIRTPMNAVIGLSTLLSRSKPLTEKQQSLVSTLQTSADSLLDLINDLLDISKIESRSLDLESIPFDIAELGEQVISILQTRAKEKNLRFEFDDECVKGQHYIGDPTRIRQVIINLVSNAVKFTEVGYVKLSITSRQLDANSELDEILFSIKDSGIGIAEDKLAKVFTKFEQADNSITRKFGGSGLGLTIAKSLTEAMGGDINVKSEVGVGSEFTVTLKLKKAAQDYAATSALPRENEINFHPKKVLLVDDHEPNLMVAGLYLNEFGFRYDIASSGMQAFEFARENDYQAIMMDVQMHGMDGFQTTKLIRQFEKENNKKPAYIIGVTAHALAGDRARCIDQGMDNYISKPFNPDELKQLILDQVRVS